MMIMIGFMTYVMGVLADTIAATRKIVEDAEYHARRADYQTSGEGNQVNVKDKERDVA